jgi:hypothetical protein
MTTQAEPSRDDDQWADLVNNIYLHGGDFSLITPGEAEELWSKLRGNAYAQLIEGLTRQLVRGERCAVCGMTDQQSKEAGYDCVNEC